MNGIDQALGSTVRIGTPLLLAGLGELVLERAGMINIGIEGVMLCGAFGGFYAGWAWQSPLLGALAGAASGALFMLLFAGMSLLARAEQIVTGMALNLLAAGITGTAYAALVASNDGVSLDAPRAAALFPSLVETPVLGALLFSQTAITWAALLLAALIWFYFEKTERGLELRAVGENPAVAEGCGIRVRAARLKACLSCGALCGLGGAFLTVSQTGSFAPNCTGGRGFVALAAVVLGRHGTLGTSAACLLFGAAFYARDAIGSGFLPSELAEILPYALALAVLCLRFKSRAAPAGLGKAW